LKTKTAVDVPADPKWRHVISATVLAAVRTDGELPATSDPMRSGWGRGELGRMGDLSLLLDRALDDIGSLAGVTRLSVEVESDHLSALVTVVGEGEEIERPEWDGGTSFRDPLTGSSFEWNQTAIKCSFRVAVDPHPSP
jgi:hypothetical protein